jgi:SAM-dependent methyltransferase
MAQPGVTDAFESILSRPSLRREGAVLDYQGERAFRLPSGNDAVVAAFLTGARPQLDRAYERHRGGDSRGADEMLAIAEGAGVSRNDFSRLVSIGDFFQIYNDLRTIQTEEVTASETIRFLVGEARVDPDSCILDIGCSCGRHLWELLGRSPLMLVGLDANLIALLLGAKAWESKGIGGVMHWVCADALQMPFKTGSFTHAQSFATLNYLPIRAALSEFGRVLAPGGRLVFTVEGSGLWKNFWDTAGSLRRRVNLLRGLAGNALLGLGLDWQEGRLTRRLSRNTQYEPGTITRIVDHTGFDVERCEVLREYKGRPWIIGVSARKRSSESGRV